MFSDDGFDPQQSAPAVPASIATASTSPAPPTPKSVIEQAFTRHGWGDMWRNGIYPYVHYHSMIHEVLAVARGRARVQFGGTQGEELDLVPGDIAVLPAGTGHQCLWASPELMVIGAYPEDREIRPLPRQQGGARQGDRDDPERAVARHRSGLRRGRAAACRSGVESQTRQAAVMSDWRSFWDSEHSIYVNARHKDVHYREIADQIAAFVPGPAARVLDYGSGDAIHADRVAAVAAEVTLCDAAPSVRAAMASRFAGNPRIKVISPEEVAALPDGRLDLIVTNSVAQYLTEDELTRLLAMFRRLLAPGGTLIFADVIPPDVGALSDVTALLRYAAKHGFLFAALVGLAKTTSRLTGKSAARSASRNTPRRSSCGSSPTPALPPSASRATWSTIRRG